MPRQDWFNAADATYKAELRELNEINFARFDAKLEQRVAEVRGELRADVAGLRSDLAATEADPIKWMFLGWAGTAFAGLLLR